ncbi:hypothetical protein [Lyngbya sp. PCC 8106]|uniref:hypothetical protein n=1 Tax=Lyngbya sp. (strain PCC 8106) TaxID=313612 RepID=UPI0000EAA11D|nr:hypothetical protein [Lyngbya sp. PCC 8106]EAW38006.1 hypothetical protein L8106_24265 [Lyngbya sp. PCC 8106]
MSISKQEAKQQLERLIFYDESSSEWVQDVWDMSPTLGETAAKLVEAFDSLIDYCPEDQLKKMLQTLYKDHLE